VFFPLPSDDQERAVGQATSPREVKSTTFRRFSDGEVCAQGVALGGDARRARQ